MTMFFKIQSLLVFVASILLCLAAGKLISHLLGGLPGSLYGMLFFCLILQLGWVKPQTVKNSVDVSIAYMPLVFLPACVGVVEYWDLIQRFGVSLVITGVLTTMITLSVVGFLASRIDID